MMVQQDCLLYMSNKMVKQTKIVTRLCYKTWRHVRWELYSLSGRAEQLSAVPRRRRPSAGTKGNQPDEMSCFDGWIPLMLHSTTDR